MTLTPNIVSSTFVANTQFKLGFASSTPNTVIIFDGSVWTSIVSASTDKVNIILQVLNSAGQPVYQNTGWATSVFTSPDLFFGTSPITQTSPITLLNDINGNLITGNYTVNAQIEVIQNWNSSPITTFGSGQTMPLLNYAYTQVSINPSILFAPNYFNANMTVSDPTNYGSYSSITYAMTVVPPVQANQSNFTSASNSLLVTSLWQNAPYQGILNNIVYYGTGTQTATISYINYYQNIVTENPMDLCGLYCCMKSLMSTRDGYKGVNQPLYEQFNCKVNEGAVLILMCKEAILCSDGESVSCYIKQFYKITGCSPDGCNCGCTDSPSPVVPVSPSQGSTGATGATGAAGANGTNGTNGTNGSSALWNPLINYENTGVGTLDVFTSNIVANTLKKAGDTIEVVQELIFAGHNNPFLIFASIYLNSASAFATPRTTTLNTGYTVTRLFISVSAVISSTNFTIVIQGTTTNYTTAKAWESEVILDEQTITNVDPSVLNTLTTDFSLYGTANSVELKNSLNKIVYVP